MKHFVTIIQNDEVCACYAFDSRKDAMARFHGELSYAMNAGITTMVVVTNRYATTVAAEKYTAPPAPVEVESGEGE